MNFIQRVKNCPRCEGNHEVIFKKINNSEEFTYFGMCLHTNQPILMQVTGFEAEPTPPRGTKNE